MPVYRYKVRDSSGNLLEGQAESFSAEALASQFQASHSMPISITEVKQSKRGGFSQLLTFRRRQKVKLDDLILFCRQMHTLNSSGVPLVRAIRGLVETSRNQTLGEALGRVVDDLESGMELSGAFSRHTDVFPPLLCRMVQVGEVTGKLDEVFMQLSVYFEREKETINRVKSALRYPSFVLTAIVGAVLFISLFVIPAFEKFFRGRRRPAFANADYHGTVAVHEALLVSAHCAVFSGCFSSAAGLENGTGALPVGPL